MFDKNRKKICLDYLIETLLGFVKLCLSLLIVSVPDRIK